MEDNEYEVAATSVKGDALIDGFPHPVFIVSKEGEMSLQNPAAGDLLDDLGLEGCLPDKVKTLLEKATSANCDYLPAEVSDALLIRRKEKEFWYLPRIFSIEGKGNSSYRGWAVELVDVTKVRWIDKIKSDLIATVSHELKTPMTGIRMILHLLSEQKVGTLNDTQRKMVISAIEDSERMLETLAELLQLSRLEIGKTDPVTLIDDLPE